MALFRLRHLVAALLLFVVPMMAPSHSGAGELGQCPEPPFITTESVAPNILLILDHSGSMGSGSGSKWNTARTVLKNVVDAFPQVRFGLMRMDASDFSGNDQISVEANVIRNGGKLLKPCGTPREEIKTYITNWGDTSNVPQTWTSLAETLATAGQYFATVVDNGTRVGRGPDGFAFYQKNYHYEGCGSGTGFLIAPSNYSTAKLSAGSQYYLDRTYTITSQPSGFQNYTAILTRNDDKNLTVAEHIVFNLPEAATVYVAYDRRATSLPTWLQSFTATSDRVYVTDSTMSYFKLYQKSYPAGQVVLGGNKNGGGANAGSNYIVYVTLSEVPTPPVGCDATTTDDMENTINSTSPIQYYCQKSFVIFITDGLANYDNNWDIITDVIGDYDNDNDTLDCKRSTGNCNTIAPIGQTHHFDDVAKFLHDNDMRSDLQGKQNVTTYVIGYQVDDPLLSSAAVKGGGQYYTVTDYAGLTSALQGAVLDILEQISSGTALATISTSAESQDSFIRAKFLPISWKGFLERFNLPYDPDDEATWEAGSILSSRVGTFSDGGDRVVFTYMGSATPTRQSFAATNDTLKTELMADWNATITETADIINFIRGAKTYEGVKYYNRDGWPLGDIIYSTPLVVGPPKFHYSEHDYQSFKNDHRDRDATIYVGANDGMLHAFDASDGSERWAFIPENLLPSLKTLTTGACHRYYVDLGPVGADVAEKNGASWTWKTILIGGTRLGGTEYFCLDITDPDSGAVSVLWDTIPFSDRKASTTPTIGRVKVKQLVGDPLEKWVAIITSGYHEGDSTGRITALNVITGTKELIWDESGTTVDELPTQAKSGSNPYYTLSSPTALDSDRDGYLDLIYAGDTEGTLWKFYHDYEDLLWKSVQLFQTGGQPITSPPELVFDEDGKLRIYFGTGQYLVGVDKQDTRRNSFYCLIEEKVTDAGLNTGHYTATTQRTKETLEDLTAVTTETQFEALTGGNETIADRVNHHGWYFDLDNPAEGFPSERSLEKPLTIAGVVFFTTFIPNEDVCGYGGDARLYYVNYKRGLPGRAGSQLAVTGGTEGQRYKDLGSGLPTKTVYYFDKQTRENKLFIQTSDTTIHQETLNIQSRPMGIISWRTLAD